MIEWNILCFKRKCGVSQRQRHSGLRSVIIWAKKFLSIFINPESEVKLLPKPFSVARCETLMFSTEFSREQERELPLRLISSSTGDKKQLIICYCK